MLGGVLGVLLVCQLSDRIRILRRMDDSMEEQEQIINKIQLETKIFSQIDRIAMMETSRDIVICTCMII